MRLTGRRSAETCRQAVEMMTAYLDGALPPRQRRDLEHHLGVCPHCAEYLTQLKATIRATGRIDAAQLSPQVRRALIDLFRQTAR